MGGCMSLESIISQTSLEWVKSRIADGYAAKGEKLSYWLSQTRTGYRVTYSHDRMEEPRGIEANREKDIVNFINEKEGK
jgi:hypothetical protein